MTDINSIIEMIEKKKRKLSYVPIEQKIHNEIYNDACDDIIEQLRKMSDWTKCIERLPAYGQPVLIKINSTVQHVSYMLDGADDTPDWFEPYLFDHADEYKIWWNHVDEWMPIPTK